MFQNDNTFFLNDFARSVRVVFDLFASVRFAFNEIVETNAARNDCENRVVVRVLFTKGVVHFDVLPV